MMQAKSSVKPMASAMLLIAEIVIVLKAVMIIRRRCVGGGWGFWCINEIGKWSGRDENGGKKDLAKMAIWRCKNGRKAKE